MEKYKYLKYIFPKGIDVFRLQFQDSFYCRRLAGKKSGFEWSLVGEECAAALSLGNLNSAPEIQQALRNLTRADGVGTH